MARDLIPDGALIHPACSIRDCDLGAWTEIGALCVLLNSSIGDYSYCARGCDIANATLAKFVNIAANVRISPG